MRINYKNQDSLDLYDVSAHYKLISANFKTFSTIFITFHAGPLCIPPHSSNPTHTIQHARVDSSNLSFLLTYLNR